MIERVVFDTSTLLGAAIKSGSIPHQALMHALDSCTVCGSEAALDELAEVVNRERFDRYLSQIDREKFLTMMRERVKLFWVEDKDTKDIEPFCRDESDNFILALALAAEADAIIASDHDLLVLNPWRGISILTPAQFVSQFRT